MKLLELLDTQALEKLSPDELVSELLRRGFFKKKLGDGLRGVAFELHNGEVLKAWISDPGYEDWIKFVLKYRNPFFVHVLGKPREFKVGRHVAKYVRLEKLGRCPNRWVEGGVSNLDSYLQNLCAYLNETRYPPFGNVHDLIRDEGGVSSPSSKLVSLTEAIVLIAEQLLHGGLDLDLHNQNLGTRDGKTPVILDPLFADRKIFGEVVDLKQVLKEI